MQKFINKKSLVIMLVSALIFIYLINNYSLIHIRKIDEGLINWLLANTNYFMVYFFKIVTLFANWQVILLTTIVLLYLIRDKMVVILITGIVGFVSVINLTLKESIERLRPNVIFLTSATGYSMPSGHALGATVFYGLIIMFFTNKIKDKRYQILVNVLLSIFILLIGFSRVYLRVHYLSDVISGHALGIIVLMIIYNLKIGIFDNIKTYIEGEDIE